MVSSTILKKPDWLTNEEISKMKKDISICNNPYTKEELEKIPLDGKIDIIRWNAYEANRILKKYGLL